MEAKLEKEISAQLETLETIQNQEIQLKQKSDEIEAFTSTKRELEAQIEALNSQIKELNDKNSANKESDQNKIEEVQQLLTQKSQESMALQSMLDNMKMTME